MSDPDLSERPEPKMDAPPDEGPGGPADMIHRDEEDLPPATPDQPRSAQVEDHEVPDELEEPEDVDEQERHVDPSDEDPA